MHAGSLTQVYTTTSKLDPLRANPDRAFMTSTPFAAQEPDQPKAGSFVLRMRGVFYHAGGAAAVMVGGAPAGAQAYVAVGGTMLATGNFNQPEGNHELDVRCVLRIHQGCVVVHGYLTSWCITPD